MKNHPKLQVFAPAKVNLFLHITGCDDASGYHYLQTLFHFINWYDVLTFYPNSGDNFRFFTTGAHANIEHNILERTLTVMREYFQKKSQTCFDVCLQKNIPFGTGLGGGSADAASFILALNYLWGLKQSKSTLKEIGLKVGCDVPVFIEGRSSWAESFGEELTPIDVPDLYYVIVWQSTASLASKIYKHPDLERAHPVYAPSNWSITNAVFGNDFEPVVIDSNKGVADVLAWFKAQQNLVKAAMTGSGSAVFGAFSNMDEAQNAFNRAPFDRKALACGVQQFNPLTL